MPAGNLPPLPDGFTLDQPAGPQLPPLPPGFALDQAQPQTARQSSAHDPLNFLAGVGEEAAHFASQLAAFPVQGAASLYELATAPPGTKVQRANEAVQSVGNEMTYQPRTESGRAISGLVDSALAIPAKIGDAAGEKVYAATGSKTLGAIADVGVQSIPVLLGAKLAEKKAPVAAGAGNAPQLAKQFVQSRTSLDWNALSSAVRDQLTQIAQDPGTLQQLDPAAVERQARLESLPVPIKATRGQITRDTAQLNNEGTLAATETGRPLKAVRDAQSGAILQNLDVLKGRVGGGAETPEQVGLSVQDAALRAKLRLSQKRVSDLYDLAKQRGELEENVSTLPLRDVVSEPVNAAHLGWAKSWLDQMRGSREQRALNGREAPPPDRNSASVNELEDLRKNAVAIAKNGGTEGYFSGKVIDAIDQSTQGVAGMVYQAARAARKAQALEFEDQGAVARLVENKSRTDRATALEDTWRKTVLGGSIQDLNNVKRSLLVGGDTTTRAAGRKAWMDIRAQTLQYIKDQATKSSAPLPDGSPAVSAAGMQQALKAIGPQKLESIFGRGTAARINTILQATKDVRTEPPRVHPGSSTFGNLVAFLERGIGKIPLLGDTASGAIRGVSKLREMGRAGREISEAQALPLDRGVSTARNALSQQRASHALTATLTPAVVPAGGRPSNGASARSAAPAAYAPTQADVDAAARMAAFAPSQAQKEANVEGNYRLGAPVTLHGVNWRVETPAGEHRVQLDEQAIQAARKAYPNKTFRAQLDAGLEQLRAGQAPEAFAMLRNAAHLPKAGSRAKRLLSDALDDGWHNPMPAHYARGDVQGADGDKLDAFLGPNAADQSLPVHVIDTNRPGTRRYDESKVMIGFTSPAAARLAFDQSYGDDVSQKIYRGMTTLSPAEFSHWVESGGTTKPAALATRAPTAEEALRSRMGRQRAGAVDRAQERLRAGLELGQSALARLSAHSDKELTTLGFAPEEIAEVRSSAAVNGALARAKQETQARERSRGVSDAALV